MLIKGVEVSPGDKITFLTKHRYDHTDRTGTFTGLLHFTHAKKMFDVASYYQNLIHADIQNPTPLVSLSFVIIENEGQTFACAEEWMKEGSFKKISNKFIDVRIMNIELESDIDELLQTIRNAGHPVQRM